MGERARSYDRRPPHGTMAEEAVKLADVAHLWLASRASRADDDPQDGDATGPTGATTSVPSEPPECRGCPVCRVRRAVAEMNPEVYHHLADAVASLGQALRALDRERRDR